MAFRTAVSLHRILVAPPQVETRPSSTLRLHPPRSDCAPPDPVSEIFREGNKLCALVEQNRSIALSTSRVVGDVLTYERDRCTRQRTDNSNPGIHDVSVPGLPCADHGNQPNGQPPHHRRPGRLNSWDGRVKPELPILRPVAVMVTIYA